MNTQPFHLRDMSNYRFCFLWGFLKPILLRSQGTIIFSFFKINSKEISQNAYEFGKNSVSALPPYERVIEN